MEFTSGFSERYQLELNAGDWRYIQMVLMREGQIMAWGLAEYINNQIQAHIDNNIIYCDFCNRYATQYKVEDPYSGLDSSGKHTITRYLCEKCGRNSKGYSRLEGANGTARKKVVEGSVNS
jgi:transposase-like protein